MKEIALGSLCEVCMYVHEDRQDKAYMSQLATSIWQMKLVSYLELSCNSTWLWSGVGWFAYNTFHVSVSLWCMVGGSVEVWTKDILDRLMEGQTRFGMSRGVKMSLVLKELK